MEGCHARGSTAPAPGRPRNQPNRMLAVHIECPRSAGFQGICARLGAAPIRLNARGPPRYLDALRAASARKAAIRTTASQAICAARSAVICCTS